MPATTARKEPSDRMKHYIKRSRSGAARVAEDPALWEKLAEEPSEEPMSRDEFRKQFSLGD